MFFNGLRPFETSKSWSAVEAVTRYLLVSFPVDSTDIINSDSSPRRSVRNIHTSLGSIALRHPCAHRNSPPPRNHPRSSWLWITSIQSQKYHVLCHCCSSAMREIQIWNELNHWSIKPHSLGLQPGSTHLRLLCVCVKKQTLNKDSRQKRWQLSLAPAGTSKMHI